MSAYVPVFAAVAPVHGRLAGSVPTAFGSTVVLFAHCDCATDFIELLAQWDVRVPLASNAGGLGGVREVRADYMTEAAAAHPGLLLARRGDGLPPRQDHPAWTVVEDAAAVAAER